MGNNGLVKATSSAEAYELALAAGDLSRLSTEERLSYLKSVCESMGLNPLTRPLEFMNFQGKTVMYARKDCADQLRKIHGISIAITDKTITEGVYTVTAKASTKDGREDEDVGSVTITGLKGDALANATMKAHTKAKRRVTLSICGLGVLDESELDTMHETMPGTNAVRVVATEAAQSITETQLKKSVDILEDFKTRIGKCHSPIELEAISGELRKQPESIRAALRSTYQYRKDYLRDAPPPDMAEREPGSDD